jgi:peroxisomal 3,2-trans-enoyl-CoA isomerase
MSYEDITVEIKGQIGIIKLNRPKVLNSFGGKLIPECVAAFRELNAHPSTVFTVLTGEGRFFSAGADVKGTVTSLTPDNHLLTVRTAVASERPPVYKNDAEKKLAFVTQFATGWFYEIC